MSKQQHFSHYQALIESISQNLDKRLKTQHSSQSQPLVVPSPDENYDDIRGNDFDIDVATTNFHEAIDEHLTWVNPYQSWRRILVIADLHLPFEHKDYLQFCKQLKAHYKPDGVIFIGDIIDNHYTSFHSSNPDGMSAGDELKLCIERVEEWHRAFPNALVMIGNHDARVLRLAKDSKISECWIRDYEEVLNTPTWKFMEEVIIDDVLYVHGSSGDAYKVATNRMISTVQGHYHTKMGIQYINNGIWGMQVGCGINHNSYAMAYAKGHSKEQLLGAGMVENGVPTVIPFYTKRARP